MKSPTIIKDKLDWYSSVLHVHINGTHLVQAILVIINVPKGDNSGILSLGNGTVLCKQQNDMTSFLKLISEFMKNP